MDQSIPPPATKNVPPVLLQPISTPSASSSQPSPSSATMQSQPDVTTLPSRSGWSNNRGAWFLLPPFLVACLVFLIAATYGGREIYLRLMHVYEYDARVTADVVTISSRVEGWIVDMPQLEGTLVTANQVVVRIDDRVSKLRADALRAQVQAVHADRERLRAERRLSENSSDAKMRTRSSGVMVSEKALSSLKSDVELAKFELERNMSLFERRVVNERQLQVAQAAVTKLEFLIQQLQAELEQAMGSLDEARMERYHLNVIDAQIVALDHLQANLEAQLAQQLVDVEDRIIKSPVPAVIDRTFVLPGEYVAAGQRILLLHNTNVVWIEANIKETQIGRIKLGQTVNVSVDAYPDDRFIGMVTRIGSVTTARFALMPSPNPSGNFTKITQRVPVRISMVEMPKLLSPGMMVEVDINVR